MKNKQTAKFLKSIRHLTKANFKSQTKSCVTSISIFKFLTKTNLNTGHPGSINDNFSF